MSMPICYNRIFRAKLRSVFFCSGAEEVNLVKSPHHNFQGHKAYEKSL